MTFWSRFHGYIFLLIIRPWVLYLAVLVGGAVGGAVGPAELGSECNYKLLY